MSITPHLHHHVNDCISLLFWELIHQLHRLLWSWRMLLQRLRMYRFVFFITRTLPFYIRHDIITHYKQQSLGMRRHRKKSTSHHPPPPPPTHPPTNNEVSTPCHGPLPIASSSPPPPSTEQRQQKNTSNHKTNRLLNQLLRWEVRTLRGVTMLNHPHCCLGIRGKSYREEEFEKIMGEPVVNVVDDAIPETNPHSSNQIVILVLICSRLRRRWGIVWRSRRELGIMVGATRDNPSDIDGGRVGYW